MRRYVAFLRGISPMNAKMSELKRCFELAGFTNVKTVLASGNVVFDSPLKSVSQIERQAESAIAKHLGRNFYTIVRPVAVLNRIIKNDPYSAFDLPDKARRVVTFRRKPDKQVNSLPLELDGARILLAERCEIFTAYVPTGRGPAFMTLIEKTFGRALTTRTWETVKKCAKA
jgi:uncharacterized protein (DUF1697 family)